MDKFRNDGSAEAFEELVRRYLPPVRRLMYNMTQNESEADDLAQDALIRIYHGLRRFRGESMLSTWVYRVSVNTANSYLRKRAVEKNIAAGCLAEVPAPPADSPEISITVMEADRAAGKAIAALPVKLRTAIVLTAVEGLDYAEAARAANCLKSTMYWRVHKARKLLKRELKDYL